MDIDPALWTATLLPVAVAAWFVRDWLRWSDEAL